jgi:hypothetical protein
MLGAWKRYPFLYDEVLQEVHVRITRRGFATKLDLAALIAWKHVQNAEWMREVLKLAPLMVQSRTEKAFAPGLSDKERISALASLPGFGGGGAFTSVLLTAWKPTEYGVYDDGGATKGWQKVVNPLCRCNPASLIVYFDHLRQIARELGPKWIPRDVDIALFVLS